MPDSSIHQATFAELDTSTLYRILRLRVDVFVVEQACAYPELDGRDVEPATRHLWVEGDGDRVAAYLRVLTDPAGPGSIVGRVVTDPAHRHRGLGRLLVRRALELAERPVRIGAQSRLRDWYAELGFEVCGEEYVEDGIPHLPMLLV